MEIKLVKIEQANIKKIRKTLRKWKYRKSGATVFDVICETDLSYFVVTETLNWMFKDGDVMVVHRHDDSEPRYVG